MSAYDISRVKSSLLHFGVGKLASGLTGLVLLLLLVRALPATDYAFMVALVAFFEIASLMLNAGVIQATLRYVPEARSKGSPHNVMTVSAWSIAARAVPMLVATLALIAFPGALARWLGFGLPTAEAVVQVFAVVLFAETIARHIDLIFELLLLQRLSQTLIWLRGMARVVGILVLSNALTHSVSIDQWAVLEACVSAAGLAGGLAMYFGAIVRPGRRSSPTIALPSLRRIVTYAMPAYGSQVLGSLQGLDACKLVVAQVASAPVVAAFGFVAALVATLQRYLPSYLLLGFVRPLFVHTSMGQGGSATTQSLASILLKLNLFVLLPAIGCSLVIGSDLVARMSGGRVTDAGFMLALMCIVLCGQVLHMIVGLLALSVEESLSAMRGSALGALVFAAAAYHADRIGVTGLLLAVVVCEAVWCMTVLQAVRGKGSNLPLNPFEYAKLALAGSIASGLSLAVSFAADDHGGPRIVMVVLAAAVAFVGLVLAFRPLNEDERIVVRKLVPSRFVVI